ncbi:hypothetical protein VPH35_002893 [Triticum aestivum]
MWAFADGDEVRMGRLRKINRWFPKAKMLNDAMEMARDKLNEEEIQRCFPNYDRQPAMGVLLWAMLKAESPIQEQRHKWRVFRSLRYSQIQPSPPPMEVVMGLPAPRSWMAPIVIEEDDEEMVTPRRKQKRAVTELPRRSPCFPRRSPRLRALSRLQ